MPLTARYCCLPNSVGVVPVCRLKARLNGETVKYPTSEAISWIIELTSSIPIMKKYEVCENKKTPWYDV
ncbi:hypothetical protein [Paenibacillus sp. UNC451MF]|uniref:hypothetical protein n=1 Tax=Paenibacillus sp. UNC451MF TaxID=1449063 RepID=UPI001E447391|nr:hypothetical protein [Paenibacillus sp. UNC451MF]